MRPENGGRLELRLVQASGRTARYALSVFSSNGDATTEVALDSVNSSLELAEWQGAPPPAWLETLLRALLRTMLRNGSGDNSTWPRRITRWRPEPRT